MFRTWRPLLVATELYNNLYLVLKKFQCLILYVLRKCIQYLDPRYPPSRFSLILITHPVYNGHFQKYVNCFYITCVIQMKSSLNNLISCFKCRLHYFIKAANKNYLKHQKQRDILKQYLVRHFIHQNKNSCLSCISAYSRTLPFVYESSIPFWYSSARPDQL